MRSCKVGTENGSAIEIHDDFRDDLLKIDVPTLVVQGTADRILPIANTADRLPDLIADIRLRHPLNTTAIPDARPAAASHADDRSTR